MYKIFHSQPLLTGPVYAAGCLQFNKSWGITARKATATALPRSSVIIKVWPNIGVQTNRGEATFHMDPTSGRGGGGQCPIVFHLGAVPEEVAGLAKCETKSSQRVLQASILWFWFSIHTLPLFQARSPARTSGSVRVSHAFLQVGHVVYSFCYLRAL